MEENYDNLIFILEESVKKNGEQPLTNEWLLNILKMVEKQQGNDYFDHECTIDDLY